MPRRGAHRAGLVALAASAIGAVASLAAPTVPRLAVRVFARVPAPGYPANAVVAADGTVYAGTFKSFSNPSDAGPSKVFAFSARGRLERTYTVAGQTRGTADAVQVATLDRHGELYLLDQDPPRVVRLDPRTGRQSTWATFASVPACPASGSSGDCTDGLAGNPPEPDFAAWGPDGSLYVTDYNQALVWRVAPGGGRARVWLTDPRLNGIIVGPAGIALMPDRHTLMLSTGGGGSDPATGKLYTVAIGSGGRPAALHQLWESAPAEAPDGFALARSGHIYIALVGPTGNAVVELSRSGQQLARFPADPVANSALPVPFDGPGSVSFDGDSVLVSNGSAIGNDPSHWAILQVGVGEPGQPLSLPPAAKKHRRHRAKKPRRHRR